MANGGLVLEVLQERLSGIRDVGLVKTPVAEIHGPVLDVRPYARLGA